MFIVITCFLATNERTLTTNNIEYNDETTTTETESSTTLSTDLSDGNKRIKRY